MSQDGGFPTAEASIGELPLEIGLETPTAGEKVEDIMKEVPTEEHVDPWIATTVQAGQKGGDCNNNVLRLCKNKCIA